MEAALAHAARNKAKAACARKDLFAKRRALIESDWGLPRRMMARPQLHKDVWTSIVVLGSDQSPHDQVEALTGNRTGCDRRLLGFGAGAMRASPTLGGTSKPESATCRRPPYARISGYDRTCSNERGMAAINSEQSLVKPRSELRRNRTAHTEPVLMRGGATLYQGDCFDWLDLREGEQHPRGSSPIRHTVWSNIRKPNSVSFGPAGAESGGFPRPLTATSGRRSRALRRWARPILRTCANSSNASEEAYPAFSFRAHTSSLPRTRWYLTSLPRGSRMPVWRAGG